MLDNYRLRMSARGAYEGESRRRNSQKIMDTSWMRDAATKPVYVKWVDSGLPFVDDSDPVLYAKFNIKSYMNITGDEIAYLLQFRLEDLKERDDIKVGSYVQIENEMGEPEWWMIVHYDDRTQFRQFSILKCLHTYKWVTFKDGYRTIHSCLGVPRSQNSYNSGVWLDYTTQVVENQNIMILPANDDANSIEYDTKFLISNEGRYPPIAWKVSKVQSKINGDITYFTMTQEQFNPAMDNAKLMLADYYQTSVTPEHLDSIESDNNNWEIVYSGQPAVRAGGGYKKFTLKEYDVDSNLINVTGSIEWSIDFTDGDSTKLEYLIEGNIFKVKCINDYSLIGKTFTIIVSDGTNSESIVVEVISL